MTAKYINWTSKLHFYTETWKKNFYMEQLEEWLNLVEKTGSVKLNKTHYRLKQASRWWFKRFTRQYGLEGYKHTSVDHSMYTRTTDLGTSIFATHVDDMLATPALSVKWCDSKQTCEIFELVDLGPAQWLLDEHRMRQKQMHCVMYTVAYHYHEVEPLG